ncbi:hypothetical protein MHPYR_430076 [uncultured Mycobacterium sp.]|uniref:Uncharacterized protein n=1 Tax=uncultured Mycobacterium sp. TaxID=171292 RepID=A0A1Y5PFI8_9MYCO|nr:hypothetical protein MHPYR_430076 [uncultured Mycobacterium sp.]
MLPTPSRADAGALGATGGQPTSGGLLSVVTNCLSAGGQPYR